VIFDSGHSAIRAQRTINDLIAAETATFGVYAGNPQARMNALADVRAIARRALAGLRDSRGSGGAGTRGSAQQVSYGSAAGPGCRCASARSG
jgi:hypothetical protein